MRIFLSCFVLGSLVLSGCAKHKYPLPQGAYRDASGKVALAETGEQYPDFYVLAWSELNVSGHRQPSCPFEVIGPIQVRSSSVDGSETWEQDKTYASRQPSLEERIPLEEARRDDPQFQTDELAFPRREQSKLLAVMRQKAQALGADAVVDIVLHPAAGGGLGVNLQGKEIGSSPAIEKITGRAIRFTDPDCRH
jgi:hypothetical protein